MKVSMAFTLVLLSVACLPSQATDQQSSMTPISKVLTMLSDLHAKISAEGAEEDKEYAELAEQCDSRSKRLGFEIKTGKSEVKDLTAAIAKEEATIKSLEAKVDELAATIATAETNLEKAKGIRATEKADYEAVVKETNEIIDTLERAIGILEKEMKGGASMMQIKSTDTVAQALAVMVRASALSSSDAAKLTSLTQSSEEDDEGEPGAPAGAVYVSQSGGIVATLTDLLGKAQEQLSTAQKAEIAAIQNFELLEQSLTDEAKYATEDTATAKKDIAVAAEEKATAEGDLEMTSKELEADETELSTLKAECMKAAETYEAAKASRAEELAALAKAKAIISETTGGAASISYDFNQLSFLQTLQQQTSKTAADLANYKAVRFVRELARKQRAPALAQLALRMASVMHASSHEQDPFAKVKGLIMDMIEKLESEADADATKKAYCDKETGETKTAIEELTTDKEKLETKIAKATAASDKLKEEVATLEKELAEIAKDQAEMDATRQETHATFVKEKTDLEAGIAGVKAALKILKEYYAKEEKAHEAAQGTGEGIIGLLEVCESDFTKGLSIRVANEEEAQASYETLTKENEISTATKQKDVEYKTKEAAGLDKEIAELTSDKASVQTTLDAKTEYLAKLDEMCVAKAETYAERTAKRAAEIAGLKEALSILEGEAALIQRTASHRALRR